ncbi:TAXI family TRAP transporter solute-binding subunit [Nocardioides litoris]|uniref:TAXI family TRAP transporter solute-binding subunit n=1 Tax=Nocardioides litoris TaxID=1926648 RepID=UPI001476A60A|nr:TAXI family TRAP transporter solute-binding subunit [Nocardioides litoris]
MSPVTRLDRRRLLRAAGLSAALLGVGGSVASATPRSRARPDLVVAGGEVGGTFLRFGSLLAAELRRTGAVGDVDVVATAGSVENLRLLAAGSADLAPALADSWDPAVRGVRAVARLYQTTLHCLVRADSPVRDVADLAGALVATGLAGSGTAETAERLLVDRLDARLRPGPRSTGVVALAGGAVDALLWWGGRPSPELLAVARTHPMRALDLASVVDAARADGAAYQRVRLPGDVWGQPDVGMAGVAALLLCRADLDEEVVRPLVDVLLTRGPQLVPQPSGGLQYLAPASLWDTGEVDLHPAAARRYRQQHG